MDHNIYIHDKTNSTNPTQPTEMGGKTTPQGFNGGKSITSTPTTGFSPENQITDVAGGVASKGIVFAAVAIAVKKTVQIGKSIVSYGANYYSTESGDYKFMNGWNNMWQGINNIKDPVQTVLSLHTNWQHIKIENNRKEQEKLLLGGTIINAEYGRYI